ncbi:PEP-utilizing enzyme [Pseudoneobacillus sp. C159]
MNVLFERPTDAQLTWYLDDHQCPVPVGPLTQSLYRYIFQGFSKAQKEFLSKEKPSNIRVLFVNGYFYVHFQQGSALSELGKQNALYSPFAWEKEWLPEIKRNLENLQQMNLEVLSNDELAFCLEDALKLYARHWEIHHSLHYMAVHKLKRWYEMRFEERADGEFIKLLQGQINPSTECDYHLWKLSRKVTPPIAEIIKLKNELPVDFEKEVHQFLMYFGHRPNQYCNIDGPTWIEDATPVLQLIVNYAEQQTEDPMARLDSLVAEREQLRQDILSLLTGKEQSDFIELHDLALRASRVKEEHSFWIELHSTAAIRRICVEFSKRLMDAGILTEKSEIQYITLNELVEFGFGISQKGIRDDIPRRREEHQQQLSIRPEPWVGRPVEENEEPLTSQSLKGIGVSPGNTVAKARVVHRLEEAYALQKGEILVAKETGPDWTPFFSFVSGIVLESHAGGILSHAAIVAREYGLPTVVGATGIMSMIKTGDTLALNGLEGTVEISTAKKG